MTTETEAKKWEQCYNVAKNEVQFLRQQIERENGRVIAMRDELLGVIEVCLYVLEKNSNEVESSRERKLAVCALTKYERAKYWKNECAEKLKSGATTERTASGALR